MRDGDSRSGGSSSLIKGWALLSTYVELKMKSFWHRLSFDQGFQCVAARSTFVGVHSNWWNWWEVENLFDARRSEETARDGNIPPTDIRLPSLHRQRSKAESKTTVFRFLLGLIWFGRMTGLLRRVGDGLIGRGAACVRILRQKGPFERGSGCKINLAEMRGEATAKKLLLVARVEIYECDRRIWPGVYVLFGRGFDLAAFHTGGTCQLQMAFCCYQS